MEKSASSELDQIFHFSYYKKQKEVTVTVMENSALEKNKKKITAFLMANLEAE
jgi:hypothetical protein